MTPARRGSLIAATWLIGLGLVFLISVRTDVAPVVRDRVDIDAQGGVGSLKVITAV